MLFTKYIKNPRKLRILLLLMIITLIILTLLLLNNGLQHTNHEHLIDENFIARVYNGDDNSKTRNSNNVKVEQSPEILRSPRENGIIQPEKYDEQKLKSRLIKEKIQNLKDFNKKNAVNPEEEHTILETVTTAIHIFYTAPVQWYKSKKSNHAPKEIFKTVSNATIGGTALAVKSASVPKVLNSAFYPALGLYKPTTGLLQQHLENIRNCGIGVLVLSYNGKASEQELYKTIIELAPQYNLSVTFELSLAGNQSQGYLEKQFQDLQTFLMLRGFYKVYSLSKKRKLPLIYISNAYKLIDSSAARAFCKNKSNNVSSIRQRVDGIFIGHIRLKNHAESMRRLCFDGFYSKLPSNGATFASTWKNWSYLKSFAMTYKMLFVPTVGPGFAERNKFPRHGDIQRHRSNGRYYGVAWRTAILNHVGFINIASYNNWPDGSQIEEVIPKAGFLDYNPGAKTKYLDLTAHWVGNFIKNRNEAAAAATNNHPNTPLSCYELLNNTIC
ncbi:glycoprotein endo-alpha-1,2-mannosidase-like protein [Glossina fuscipes]|uniref:Glycoprotein endo-alpha-1,2-mannosidase-like protein n=1 Tax=Glossina fuscipes TaxID=7396 RepID=A0A8U0WFD0_9MUSC|nr:glycoprotein endo-alpha-1,2-mannosidase-like protein [Glossina fuscipes]KAI9585427.1 hypothetical protein GQX74_001274 [Glossina fuscipes]